MFDEALDTEKFADKVKQDRVKVLRLGLNSTPTVFVNGRRVAEKTHESLKAAIETAKKEVAMK
ncbi:MAG: thioredoxin domain-containing protein [Candidatus Jettenia sp. CY-1]|nr:MAG: thioredoxin domain-containing protein [Candidatus Jettenia sp. CY-1]